MTNIIGWILIGLAILTTVLGLAISIKPTAFGKPLGPEARASMLASAFFAYSALFWGIGTWMVAKADATRDKRAQQQALLDAVAIDLKRGADACLGHMDIRRKLGPGMGRVIGLVPQLQLEILLRSDIPLSSHARYTAALVIEDATMVNGLLSPLNIERKDMERSLHSMCTALSANRSLFESHLSASLRDVGLQYRSESQ